MRHNKNGLFLIEIIINIFFFSILLVISLQLFVKAHGLSQDATELHQAVALTENGIARFQNGEIDKYGIFYYDSDFTVCDMNVAAYVLTVEPVDISSLKEDTSLKKATFKFGTMDGELIYQVDASTYDRKEVDL